MNDRFRTRLGLGVATVGLLALSACMAHQPPPQGGEAPGFWLGLWHGVIAPIAFVVGLFKPGVRLYAFPNGGALYDLGFLLGLTTWAGGGAAARRGS